jgi:adenylate cyclase
MCHAHRAKHASFHSTGITFVAKQQMANPMVPARLLPNIRYGTERYPENVARRLRALNLTSWIIAGVAAIFAIAQFIDPSPGVWKNGVANAVGGITMMAIPFLHRFGALVGPIVFNINSYMIIWADCSLTGIGNGMQMYYLGAAALGVLFVGTERIALASVMGLVAVLLTIAVEVLVPRSTGLQSDTAMFYNFIGTAIGCTGTLLAIVFYALREAARAEAVAQHEHERSESLLANILPATIAERLKSNPRRIADSCSEATILFVDIVGFTKLSEEMTAEALVDLLNSVFSEIDDLTEKYALEKIKTIGDAYMVVAGAPKRRRDHAEAIAAMSLEIKDSVARLATPAQYSLDFRIGIHSGPVVAGVIGKKKFSYDMWGDSVNTAARMEAHGIPGEIQVSAHFRDLLKDKFLFVERGLVDVKGKGELLTYLLKGHRPGNRLL